MDTQTTTPYSYIQSLFRENILRQLFPLTAAWSLLLLFAEELDDLQRSNPIPEGGVLHFLFEFLVFWFPPLVVFAAAFWLIKRRPEFLRMDKTVPLLKTIIRMLCHGLILFVLLTVITVILFYLFYDPSEDPQGQFHTWVWLGGLLYASALTPVATLFTVWLNRNRNKRSDATIAL